MAAPTVQKSKNLNRSTQFGTYPKDPNRNWIQKENYSIFQDVSAGNASPATVATSADTVLAVPGAATTLRIYSNQDLRISDAAAGAAGYFVIPKLTPYDWPCATPTNDPNSGNTGSIYLRADSSSATVQFAFLCI